MSQNFFEKVQSMLIKKQAKVEEDLKSVQDDDPVLSDGLAESSESGTDAWKNEAHTTLTAIRNNLQENLNRIKKALMNLKSGSYGKCEKCTKAIEPQRLEAMPEATLCITCSKKKSS